MKKKSFILLLVVATLVIINESYAAFPVEKKSTNSETVIEEINTNSIENSKSNQITKKEKSEKKENKNNKAGGKDQLIALILSILVGTLGVHRFYLGYTWQGVVQLLTFGGCGIWTLIDIIRIAQGKLQPKDGSYAQTLKNRE